MSQPLGRAAGNSLEVLEAVDLLRGGGPADVRALTLDLAEIMLRLAGGDTSPGAARERAERALDSGAAWQRFLALVEAQGGDPRRVETGKGMASAPVVSNVTVARSGRIAAIDTFGLGELVVGIGGGRRSKEDSIDPRVGLVVLRRVGDAVGPDEPVAQLHLAAADPEAVETAAKCFRIGPAAVPAPRLLIEHVR
jgi:thymidine phosphorylase